MLAGGGELDGRRIISKKTLELMTQNRIGDRFALMPGLKYGLGFGLIFNGDAKSGSRALDRFFWGGIFSTNFWVDPRHEIVGVSMTQMLPTSFIADLKLREIVNDAIEDH